MGSEEDAHWNVKREGIARQRVPFDVAICPLKMKHKQPIESALICVVVFLPETVGRLGSYLVNSLHDYIDMSRSCRAFPIVASSNIFSYLVDAAYI
jgi:hypothetical protein